MLIKLWQKSLIKAATSKRLQGLMQNSRSTTSLAHKYIGGSDAKEAVETSKHLKSQGILSSLFYLGEYVDSVELIAENLEAKKEAISYLNKAHLQLHVSIDPTQLGGKIDWRLGTENIENLANKIAYDLSNEDNHCIMLDMEDFSVNHATIDLHNQLKDKGLPCALTLQARLKKTEKDMQAQIAMGSMVRLVKGAFPTDSNREYQGTKAIKDNYKKLVEMMFSPTARLSKFYPIIATHDTKLHEFALACAKRSGWEQGSYEFEMLLGARDDVAENLARAGEKIRLYVPFGQDWWPYAARRIGENPSAAPLLIRSLLNK